MENGKVTEWIGNWILCSSHKQKHVPTGHLIIITFFFGGGGFDREGEKKGKGTLVWLRFTPGGRKRAGMCWYDRRRVFPRLTA